MFRKRSFLSIFQWGILGLPHETFIIPVRSGRSSWSEKVLNAQSVKELYKRQHQYSVCPYLFSLELLINDIC